MGHRMREIDLMVEVLLVNLVGDSGHLSAPVGDGRLLFASDASSSSSSAAATASSFLIILLPLLLSLVSILKPISIPHLNSFKIKTHRKLNIR